MATAKIIELDDGNTCKLCNNALGNYTCPKCNVLYCSLDCYRSTQHLECSESFYRDCVSEQISANADDEQSAAKMVEILKKMQQQQQHSDVTTDSNGGSEEDLLDSDDDEYLDLGDRLAGIDLNDPEKVWEQLNSDERQEFEAFLRSGDISRFIPQWQAWWSKNYGKAVLDVADLDNHKKTCPKILATIKDFKTICKKTPADCVEYNLINILGAYVFTMRYFNGETHDHGKEAVACVSTLSLCLKVGRNFDSYDTAVDSVRQECLATDWIQTDRENVDLMKEDVHKVLQGPHSTDNKFYVLCALSDLHELLVASLNCDAETQGGGSFSKVFPESRFPEVRLETKADVKRHIKKVEYFLAYAKDFWQY